jgi:FeS assembly SUF system protein
MTDIMTDTRAGSAVSTLPATASNAAGAQEPDEGVLTALRSVYDPEIPVNVYDLGLIYRLNRDAQGFVDIDMTLTAPGCPVAGDIVKMVETAVQAVDGVQAVKVTLVFEPPWDKSRMSEDVKLELGLL